MAHLEPALLRDLSARGRIARWGVTFERFEAVLVRSVKKAFPDQGTSSDHHGDYLRRLHLEDLALACACEDGHEGAWEHFVREFRPQLYRAASAIDATGGARDLADSLYADLFGLKEQDGVRQSLLRYFHGRSSLATWLRSVLSQRHVDRLRAGKRTEPLADGHEAPGNQPPRFALRRSAGALAQAEGAPYMAPASAPEPDRARHVAALMTALATAIGALGVRDRLRLACYYAQDLTLAQIGGLTGEHEATVSRHLTRTRLEVRRHVEDQLRQEHRMAPEEIAECFAQGVEDAGVLDVAELLATPEARKDFPPDRSN